MKKRLLYTLLLIAGIILWGTRIILSGADDMGMGTGPDIRGIAIELFGYPLCDIPIRSSPYLISKIIYDVFFVIKIPLLVFIAVKTTKVLIINPIKSRFNCHYSADGIDPE